MDTFRYAHEHRDEVVWMSQNTNHIPTTPRLREVLLDAVANGEYSYYPFTRGLFGLPDLILKDLGLDGTRHEAHVTAGALEATDLVTRTLLEPGDEVIATDPSFLPIHQQIVLARAKPVELPIYQHPWKLTAEQVQEAITPRTRMLLLIDPINPLGTEYTREEVRALAEVCRDHGIYLLHDITYRDFAYRPSLAGEWAPEHTLYAYSFSKNCGFAGLRLGALVAPAPLMAKVRPRFTNVLGTNVLAQRAGKVALETKAEWLPRVLDISRGNQDAIAKLVGGMEGLSIPVYPSSTNTLVIDVSARGLDPVALEQELLFQHHVFIRNGPYLSKRFGPRFVRVSFSVTPEHCRRFLDAFPLAVEAVAGKARAAARNP